MSIVIGILVVIMTFINIYMYKSAREYKVFMAMALSLTSLTLCWEYSKVSSWIKIGDTAALLDVVPSMEKILWILAITSIILNLIPIVLEYKNKKS